MYFYGLDVPESEKSCRMQHIFGVLTGKAEYYMSANGDFSGTATFYGVSESSRGVPPANPLQGLIVCRLQAVFQPYEIVFAKHGQVIEGFIGNAVGTSAYA